jgi:hypothetical protein
MTTTFDNDMGDSERLDFLMALCMLLVKRAGGSLAYSEAELRAMESGEEYNGLSFSKQSRLTSPGEVFVALTKRPVINVKAGDGEQVANDEKIIALDMSDSRVQEEGRRILRDSEAALLLAFQTPEQSGQDRNTEEPYDIDQMTGPRPNRQCKKCGAPLANWVKLCPGCLTPVEERGDRIERVVIGIDAAGDDRKDVTRLVHSVETRTGGEPGGGKTNRLLEGSEETKILKRLPGRKADDDSL